MSYRLRERGCFVDPPEALRRKSSAISTRKSHTARTRATRAKSLGTNRMAVTQHREALDHEGRRGFVPERHTRI